MNIIQCRIVPWVKAAVKRGEHTLSAKGHITNRKYFGLTYQSRHGAMRDGRCKIYQNSIPGYMYIIRINHSELFKANRVFRICNRSKQVYNRLSGLSLSPRTKERADRKPLENQFPPSLPLRHRQTRDTHPYFHPIVALWQIWFGERWLRKLVQRW